MRPRSSLPSGFEERSDRRRGLHGLGERSERRTSLRCSGPHGLAIGQLIFGHWRIPRLRTLERLSANIGPRKVNEDRIQAFTSLDAQRERCRVRRRPADPSCRLRGNTKVADGVGPALGHPSRANAAGSTRKMVSGSRGLIGYEPQGTA